MTRQKRRGQFAWPYFLYIFEILLTWNSVSSKPCILQRNGTPNCLGDQLCLSITSTASQDPFLAKMLLLSLKPFYWSTKCIHDITSNPAFNWTDNELAGLTQGLAPDDANAKHTIINRSPDQEFGAKMRDYIPVIKDLIDYARLLDIPGTFRARQRGLSFAGNARKKRDVSSGEATCLSVIDPSSWPVDRLNNLNLSVFTDCPSTLNVNGYNNSQLVAIANRASQALGDPCADWNETSLQQLGVIVFGLPTENISCLDMSDPETISSIGGRRLQEMLDPAKSKAVFDTWFKEVNVTYLTAENITAIGVVSCGISDASSIFSPYEYEKASKFIGRIDCYSSITLSVFASYAQILYGNGTTISISDVSNIGTVIAGMDLTFFNDVSPDKISAITPAAIRLIKPCYMANLTVAQVEAFASAQAMAVTDDQLKMLNGTALFDIIIMKRTGTTLSDSSSTDVPSAQQTSHHESLLTEEPIDTISAAAASSELSLENLETSEDPSARISETGAIPVATTTNPASPESQRRPANVETGAATTPSLPRTRSLPPLPPLFDQKNILQFIDRLSELPTEDFITRVLPEALNPLVLNSLKLDLLTGTQLLAIRNKIEQLLAKSGFKFDPLLLASAGPLVSKLMLQKFDLSQILSVMKLMASQMNTATARLYGPSIARLLLGSGDAKDLVAKMAGCRMAMAGVSPTDFLNSIKNKLFNSDIIQSLFNVTFTEKQARLLYNKFQGDCPMDLSKKTPLELRNYFEILGSLKQAVHPDSVSGIDSPTAAFVILGVSLSHVVTRAVDLGATQLSMPLQKRLFEKIRKSGYVDIKSEHILTLLFSRLLTVESVKQISISVCELFKLQMPYDAVFKDVSPNPAVLSALYDKCKPVLGSFCSTFDDRHGILSIGAPPSDILSIRNDVSLFSYCVPNICAQIHLATAAQVDALLTVVKNHLDKFHDFPIVYRRVECLLPYLEVQYFDQSLTVEQKTEICRLISCQSCINIPSSALKVILNFCIKNGVPVKSLVCSTNGKGNCLMQVLTEDYGLHFNITGTPGVVEVIDRLQSAVMDCSVRRELFDFIKGNLSLSDKNNIALYGSLVDQFSDDDWKAIPDSVLCDLINMVCNVWATWDKYQAQRLAQNLKPVKLCTNRVAVLAKLQAADASPDCSSSPSRRRKRDTGALTCDQINQMGQSVASLPVAQLQSLSVSDFIDCMDVLGKIPGFNEDQWAALASMAKQEQVYTSECIMWSSENIVSAAGIVTGLSPAEIGSLRLNDLNAISAIGHNGLWSVHKLLKAFAVVKQMYKSNDVSRFTSAELSSLGEILCGATVDDLVNLVADEVCGAIEDIGELSTCEDQQLQELIKKVKGCAGLGQDVVSWTPSIITAIGSLIGGLTKYDISKLNRAQIEAIQIEAIRKIPPIQFSGFSGIQLECFSTYQAAVITTAQYQSLDSERQTIVQNKLVSLSDDLTQSPKWVDTGGKNDCNQLLISRMQLATAIFAIFMSNWYGNMPVVA